jgi:hypothetical protein
MLPSAFARTNATAVRRGGVPKPVLIAAIVAGVVVVLFAGVAATMGVAPTPQPQTLELPLQ